MKCEDCRYFYKTDVTYTKITYCSLRNKDVEIYKTVKERSCGSDCSCPGQ